MTEKNMKPFMRHLKQAHRILPGAKHCDEKDAELRQKIRKLEKAVGKREKKVVRAEGKKN